MRLQDTTLQIVFDQSQKFEVSWKLIAAIILIESNGDNYAIRYEPSFNYFKDVSTYARKNNISKETEEVLQRSSIGLMQVMGCRARELGFEDNLLELTQPKTGIELGVKNIKFLQKRNLFLDDIIAAYNAGSAIKTKGRYINQLYVDKVKNKMQEIKG